MEKFIRLVAGARFDEIAKAPGAGASGGLVAGLMSAFKNVSIINGMDFFAQMTSLEEQIANTDLVLTGEGSVDEQTLQGKVVSKILDLCEKQKKPLIILCGVNKLGYSKLGKAQIYDLVGHVGKEKALKETRESLESLFDEIFKRG